MSERLYKVVNGKRVEMTAGEEAAVRAEWEKPVVAAPTPITAQRLADILVAKGLLSEGDLVEAVEQKKG